MSDEGICANWRVAIVPGGSERPIYGRLRLVSREQMVVKADHNLLAGRPCNIALMLPKSNVAEPARFVEGQGIIVRTVLSSAQFHILVDFLELKGNGKALLEERIKKHKEMWRLS